MRPPLVSAELIADSMPASNGCSARAVRQRGRVAPAVQAGCWVVPLRPCFLVGELRRTPWASTGGTGAPGPLLSASQGAVGPGGVGGCCPRRTAARLAHEHWARALGTRIWVERPMLEPPWQGAGAARVEAGVSAPRKQSGVSPST